jgi:hypothetical protein
MILSWPSETFRPEFNNATISAIGRPVEFLYVYSSYPCPVCSLDPVSNTSTDSFCVVCSGAYWLETISGVSISGHVTWKPADKLGWVTGGQLWEGDCRVRINYTDGIFAIIDKTKTVVVDDKEMQIKTIDLRGSPTVNRIILMLREREK